MQDTQIEALAQAASATANGKPRRLQLVIANKNYSSWSMRPWLVLSAFGIPFEEIRIALDQPDTAREIAKFSPSGRVPVLIADGLTIGDSLAICEYLAEAFPEYGMWPADARARAVARSACAEMHSSFAALRRDMSMNIRARRPGEGRTPEAQGDIGRICEIWESALLEYGQRDGSGFLFGEFSIADAFFAPVVMRFITYDVMLPPMLQTWDDRVANVHENLRGRRRGAR
jgi:glutathione S-transferase